MGYALRDAAQLVLGSASKCVFHAIADTHFSRSRTVFQTIPGTVSR